MNIPAEHEKNVFGSFDGNIKKIERTLHVTVIARDSQVKIIGSDVAAKRARSVFEQLIELSKRGNTITEQNVDYALSLSYDNKESAIVDLDDNIICRTVMGKPVKPKTLGQKKYVDQIRERMIVFGIGPAGTGKTYLAMAMAITALKNNEVNKIILTRPAIEAGENLGFLPGDLQSKVDPYLRPLYDALHEMFGIEQVQRFMERGTIEVAPLAYMRGRTLENAFVILDEAQNTTAEQMKMFLTRLGNNSKMVVNGDKTQIDLPPRVVSGLGEAEKVLRHVPGINMVYFSDQDVVRHDLVGRIVKAYDAYHERKLAGETAESNAVSKENIAKG